MRVLAVVVLYKRSLEQSQTLVSLGAAFRRYPGALKFFRVLVWDNSPESLKNPKLGFPFDYVHSTKNAGTSGAFNGAMELAERSGIPWLLLLDQDTTFPEEFVIKMAEYGRRFANDLQVGAVVPLLRCRGRLISPNHLASFYRVLPVPRTSHGAYYKEQVLACDSATLMRVTALREAGGYDEGLFWLDFSDIYVFAAFFRNGRSVYIANDLQLEHSLSTTNYGDDMTPQRYRNFLAAEGAFLQLYGSRWDNAALTVRLLARAAKQYLRHKDKTFAKMSWKALLGRLLHPRESRMKIWQKELTSANTAFGL
jgi:GT2 family glycosyltransferase